MAYGGWRLGCRHLVARDATEQGAQQGRRVEGVGCSRTRLSYQSGLPSLLPVDRRICICSGRRLQMEWHCECEQKACSVWGLLLCIHAMHLMGLGEGGVWLPASKDIPLPLPGRRVTPRQSHQTSSTMHTVSGGTRAWFRLGTRTAGGSRWLGIQLSRPCGHRSCGCACRSHFPPSSLQPALPVHCWALSVRWAGTPQSCPALGPHARGGHMCCLRWPLVLVHVSTARRLASLLCLLQSWGTSSGRRTRMR